MADEFVGAKLPDGRQDLSIAEAEQQSHAQSLRRYKGRRERERKKEGKGNTRSQNHRRESLSITHTLATPPTE